MTTDGAFSGLTENDRKEDLSLAYVRAIVAVAGYSVCRVERDKGIDAYIDSQGARGLPAGPLLLLQVKCTSNAHRRRTSYRFALDAAAYNKLVAPTSLDSYLVVVRVPSDPGDWLTQSDERLELRHCAYFWDPRGRAPTSNSSSVTIESPSEQVFSIGNLHQLMDRANSSRRSGT